MTDSGHQNDGHIFVPSGCTFAQLEGESSIPPVLSSTPLTTCRGYSFPDNCLTDKRKNPVDTSHQHNHDGRHQPTAMSSSPLVESPCNLKGGDSYHPCCHWRHLPRILIPRRLPAKGKNPVNFYCINCNCNKRKQEGKKTPTLPPNASGTSQNIAECVGSVRNRMTQRTIPACKGRDMQWQPQQSAMATASPGNVFTSFFWVNSPLTLLIQQNTVKAANPMQTSTANASIKHQNKLKHTQQSTTICDQYWQKKKRWIY